jgi:hypothetical protein
MAQFDILSDEFAKAAEAAALQARAQALRAGHSVVSLDSNGHYIEERPDGRRFEIRFDRSRPRESRRVIVRELVTTAA